jgi:hypothetical protein
VIVTPSNLGATHHSVPNSAHLLDKQGIALVDKAVPENSGGSSNNYSNQAPTNKSYSDSSATPESQFNSENSECLQVLRFYDALNTILAHAAQQDEEEENRTKQVDKDQDKVQSQPFSNSSMPLPSYDSFNPSFVPLAHQDSVQNVDSTFNIFSCDCYQMEDPFHITLRVHQ